MFCAHSELRQGVTAPSAPLPLIDTPLFGVPMGYVNPFEFLRGHIIALGYRVTLFA